MKNKNVKKFLSAAAVLAISATAAISVIPVAGCAGETVAASEEIEKLITADENHSVNNISTATGTVKTLNTGTTYYVAPGGSTMNDGLSWDSPYDIAELLRGTHIQLQPGDTVYVKPGTYSITSLVTIPTEINGEYNNYIRIINAALEEESEYEGDDTIVTLDFSEQQFDSTSRGVQLYGSYTYWYGVDVCGAGDNGLYVGGSYNTIEFCEFYNNRDTGLQLGRVQSPDISIDKWPSYNLIKNCTSHNNYDNETYGENADGFAAKLTVGYGNVFDGCIAYRNSDDGWDLYAKTDSGNIGCVIIYNCVAFENGYIEYTQQECNKLFNSWTNVYSEAGLKDSDGNAYTKDDDEYYGLASYKTRDGDGNGFKLGGSVMEGDVKMYNCLSFNNRMHGVTDNSNPGYLYVEGVTSYDNSAAIDNNPNSSTFGQIIKTENDDTHSNIDLARQTYSYNSVVNTLSVSSGVAVSLSADAYRGSVTDSVLYAKPAANYVVGSLDADTKTGSNTYTSQGSQLVASQMFKTLPVDYSSGSPVYNITGLEDLYEDTCGGALSPDRVHVKYRNEDGSINMGNILAKTSAADNLISGKDIGSTLNLSSWGRYEHFFENDFVDGSLNSEDEARLARAIETLTINTDAKAVYQDFEVPIKMNNCTIEWTSSDDEIVTVKLNDKGLPDVEESISTSQYVTMQVYRPSSEDVKVTITAHITSGTATGEKEFELNIKAGTPTIGAIKVLTEKGEIVQDGGSYVVDQYALFKEPVVQVENGLDYSGKLLKPDQYTYTTTYMYAANKNSPFVKIMDFTPSNAGVYKVTQTVTMNSNSKSMTYTIYVSSENATVDFANNSDSVVVNKDGYMISGELSNATGILYAVSSSSELNVTKDNIKTLAGVESYSFRTDNINFQFKNSNSNAYTIYYAIANLSGEITSDIYSVEIPVVEISTTANFMKIAGGEKIGSENPQTTIYRLTSDLDFSSVKYSVKTGGFTGLLNGAGYTVKNVTVSGSGTTGLFYKVQGGTIENIKFDNVKITSTGTKNGIVAQGYGGYYHNIAITNININAGERTGGLIGQVYDYMLPTIISNVSVVNELGSDYKISSGTSSRAAGLIGLIQASSSTNYDCIIEISDCYVITDLIGAQQVGGMVGSYDNAKANLNYDLVITRCYFGGTATTTYGTPRVGGIIGYQSGNVGIFTIKSCISVGEIYYGSDATKLVVSLKTASLIVGGYSSAAENIVRDCIATIEEYNSDYIVEMYTTTNLQRNIAGIKDVLGEGYETSWEFVYDDSNPDNLKAPYIVLKFLPV